MMPPTRGPHRSHSFRPSDLSPLSRESLRRSVSLPSPNFPLDQGLLAQIEHLEDDVEHGLSGTPTRKWFLPSSSSSPGSTTLLGSSTPSSYWKSGSSFKQLLVSRSKFRRNEGSKWGSSESFNFAFSFPATKSPIFEKKQHVRERMYNIFRSPILWLYVLLTCIALWMLQEALVGMFSLSHPSGPASGVVQRVSRMVGTDMMFIGAGDARIHYVGRWTATPNRMRWDGSFPGVYFDLNVTGTSTLLLSLANLPANHKLLVSPSVTSPARISLSAARSTTTAATPNINRRIHNHLSFTASTRLRITTGPISLLARIDDEEYIALPNVSQLVPIRVGDLVRRDWHNIRIIAPMTDGNGSEMVQLEGLWIEKGARLGYVDGARAEGAEDDDIKFAEEHSEVGKAHEKGLSRLWHFHLHHSHATSQSSDPAAVTHHDDERGFVRRRKVLEIITDMPGSHSAAGLRGSNGPRGLLAGVMGWDYLLGEMFGVDHISVGVEGMCLIPDCLARSVEGIENVEGGTKIDIREHGMGDVYFRSGPPSSPHSKHTWSFYNGIPNVIIMNLGSSDGDSFARYADVYNRSIIDLMSDFEDTYVSLIKAIRTLAYPSVSPLSNAGSYLSTSRKRSNSRRGRAAYQGELAVAFEVQYPASDYLGYDGSDGDGINGIDEDDEPFGGPLIPIFVMRPFGSEMERSALEVVRRLRKDGDKNVFWIDTSGWLEIPNPPHGTVPSKADETEDYYFAAGNSSAPSDISTYLLSQFKLTPRANQKVAIYLHMHVCRYLAAKGDKCPFLKSQTYEGKVYEPAMERLERWTQGEVEGKVKAVLMEKERPKAEKGEEKGLDGL